MLSINQATVAQFKAETFHLHNCCEKGMMDVLIRRTISEVNRQMITDLVLFSIDTNGKVVLEW